MITVEVSTPILNFFNYIQQNYIHIYPNYWTSIISASLNSTRISWWEAVKECILWTEMGVRKQNNHSLLVRINTRLLYTPLIRWFLSLDLMMALWGNSWLFFWWFSSIFNKKSSTPMIQLKNISKYPIAGIHMPSYEIKSK